MLHIKWAPVFKTSLQERLQLFAVLIWLSILTLGPFVFLFVFVYYLLFGNLLVRFLFTLYLIHIVANRDVGDKGGKGSGYNFARKNFIWKLIGDYFPIDLVKTADLPANRNYLFAIFPHGIVSFGASYNFVSYCSKFRDYYPGLRTKLCTLNLNFRMPFSREITLAYGMATASENSITTILSSSNDPSHPDNSDGYTSNVAGVVVGGAQEALYARPNNYQIVLKKRKGFVRLAIKTGSSLVPVFSFGEIDIYDQIPNPPGSRLRRFQEYFKKCSGVSPIIVKGRGLCQYTFGLIPHRKRITTVVGAPIDVIKNENPTQDEIDTVHKKFVDALIDLFETHKAKYITNAINTKLIIE